ncbi:hypothetical protein BU24DRAFT_9082 [Aaosphaeria arxii CBS 175.79]|uniref:Uncharacterized protein n=1 Tax=Aaosphaeria arxii CBS 175.79 TaxID=1450172 RepID=A0A6A5Y8D8_9PLEO|nr:uncharacterized protein BU24DRAFT_9082 [Aaosphaeria arxii CBS 175.79]KAF2020824.1 hypothetical protein BU24DRAFT_9082 [Aaosphaeria arxii CBS 175.79]
MKFLRSIGHWLRRLAPCAVTGASALPEYSFNPFSYVAQHLHAHTPTYRHTYPSTKNATLPYHTCGVRSTAFGLCLATASTHKDDLELPPLLHTTFARIAAGPGSHQLHNIGNDFLQLANVTRPQSCPCPPRKTLTFLFFQRPAARPRRRLTRLLDWK